MDCREVAELLPDYLQHSLNDMQLTTVQEHLRCCADCREEAELWHRLGSIPADRPGEPLRPRFQEMLAAYQEGRRSRPRGREWSGAVRGNRWALPAAATALVAVAFTAGIFVERTATIDTELTALREELANTRQMMTLSLLQNHSASDRLEGINWSTKLPQRDRQIEEALLDRLRFDGSDDVRLAAVDALRRFSEEPAVRSAVCSSLQYQKSPMVQIALVEFLVECRDHDAVKSLKAFESGADLLPEVKQKIRWALSQLNRG